MAENASIFFAFNEFQELIRRATNRSLSEKATLPQLALAAAGAGFITSFFLYVAIPLFTISHLKDKFPQNAY
jgi:ornithine carrier protein